MGGQFRASIKIASGKRFNAEVVDSDFGGAYGLHLVPAAKGNIVEIVRAEYAALLSSIAKNCCKNMPFKTAQAQVKLAKFAQKKERLNAFPFFVLLAKNSS